LDTILRRFDEGLPWGDDAAPIGITLVSAAGGSSGTGMTHE